MAATSVRLECKADDAVQEMELKHMIAAEELEAAYERRLALEMERFQRLQDEVVDYKLAASEKMGEMEEGHSTAAAAAATDRAAAERAAEARCRRPDHLTHIVSYLVLKQRRV